MKELQLTSKKKNYNILISLDKTYKIENPSWYVKNRRLMCGSTSIQVVSKNRNRY